MTGRDKFDLLLLSQCSRMHSRQNRSVPEKCKARIASRAQKAPELCAPPLVSTLTAALGAVQMLGRANRYRTKHPLPFCSCFRLTRGRYHGGRRPSSDDSFHSPTVIPPSALDKPSIMKRYHRRGTCSHTSPRRSPTMVTLPDTRFVECRWWNDGWTVKTVVT